MPVVGDFYCKTCARKMKGRLAVEHHKQGHEVWHLNAETGEMTHRYPERPPDEIKPPPAITAEGETRIKHQYKGYKKDEHDFVFILFSDGKIEDMRLEYPLLFPIYELARTNLNYEGTFPQFLADSVETMFAAAGYELVLAPKQQREIYDEVARLKADGKLKVTHDEKGIRLEVNHERGDRNEDKGAGAEAGAGEPGGNATPAGEERGEERASELE